VGCQPRGNRALFGEIPVLSHLFAAYLSAQDFASTIDCALLFLNILKQKASSIWVLAGDVKICALFCRYKSGQQMKRIWV
jgi:hypothetical protein